MDTNQTEWDIHADYNHRLMLADQELKKAQEHMNNAKELLNEGR